MITINDKDNEKVCLVEISGQLMADEAINLRQNLEEWDRYAQNHFAVDLSGVSFVDSSGIGALVAAHKNLKKQGKNISFYGMTGQVGEMLKFLRFDKVIPCYPDLDSLLKGQKL